jgi:hypothetical protein
MLGAVVPQHLFGMLELEGDLRLLVCLLFGTLLLSEPGRWGVGIHGCLL